MPAKINEKGHRYGRLVVVKESNLRWGNHVCWRCKCDCGKYTVVDGNALRSGNTKSCGCYQRDFTSDRMTGKRLSESSLNKVREANTINELGNRYGRLIVVAKSRVRPGGRVGWRCKCDCGNYKVISGKSLRNGETRSCGCYQRERASEAQRARHRKLRAKRKLLNR